MGCISVTSQVPDHCISVTSQVPDHYIDITSTERGECSIPIPIPQFEYLDSGYGSAEYSTAEHFISYEHHTTQIRITNLPDILDLGLHYIIGTGFPTRVDESDGTVSVDLPYKDSTNGTLASWQLGVAFFDTCGKYAEHIHTTNVEYEKEGKIYYENTDGTNGWLHPLHFSSLFKRNNNVKKIVIHKLPKLPKDDTSWSHMCFNCRSLEVFEVLCDTSSVTDMNSTWYGCYSLTSFPDIDTSSVTDMGYAWYACLSLTSFPDIDTSSVTNMWYAWAGCRSLTSFPDIDTSSVTNMEDAWAGCRSLTSFPHIDTSSVTNMEDAWYRCRGLPIEPCAGSTGETFRRYLFDDGTPVPSGDGETVYCGQ